MVRHGRQESKKIEKVVFGSALIALIWGAGFLHSAYKNKPDLKTENVIGGEAPEKFYDIRGNRVYLEIDGLPVQQYFIRK